MAITSNSVQNNQNRSGNLNTTAAKRAYRTSGGTINVREGEVLKGVVSDIHGNVITISMDDGSSFSGKLPEASQYSIGQKAKFQITSMENGTIYMKAISQAYLLGMEDTIEQALEEAGLPKSPRNLEIVRSLLQNQQSISRDNIMNSLQLCAKYPLADVNTVISMKRLGMPMDTATVTQFDNYRNQSHQLLYRMDSLTDSIGELLTDLVNENPSIARHAAGEMLNIALNSMPSLEEFNLAVRTAENNPETGGQILSGWMNSAAPDGSGAIPSPGVTGDSTADGTTGQVSSQADASALPGENGNIPGSAGPASNTEPVNTETTDPASVNAGTAENAVNAENAPVSVTDTEHAQNATAENQSPDGTTIQPDSIHPSGETETERTENSANEPAASAAGQKQAANASPFARMKQLFTNMTNRPSEETVKTSDHPLFIPEQTGHLLASKDRLELAQFLGRFTSNAKMLASLENGTLTTRELLAGIKGLLSAMPDKELHTLLTSESFSRVMKGQFLSGWTLSPNGLKEENGMERLYGKMQEQLTELTNLSRMFATRPTGEAIIHTTTDMQQNMEFMKLLGEHFAYMQLPIKLSEENAHGDLYVMTRKEALKKSKDNLKVLLHLEMDSLGVLDIHITKEHTNISTKFFTEKEAARKLLEKNANLLKDAINQQGYSFTSEFATKENDIDLIHDFMETNSPAPIGSVTRYNFDLRA